MARLPKAIATAYHEAGHAVVGYVLGRNVPRKISVVPEGASLGRTHNDPWPRSFRPELNLSPLTKERLEVETVTVLSGFEAERRHAGRADRFGASDDFKGAHIYALLVAGDDEGAAAYIKWCTFLARRAVDRNWPAIGRFARRLADAGELQGAELRAALTDACRPASPARRWGGKR